jgi:hypothetical protein
MSGIIAAMSVGWGLLTVTCSDINKGGFNSTITTLSADGAASGGSGSYTFTWTFDSGDPSIIVMSVTDPHTTFRAQGLEPEASVSSVFLLTATDTLSGQSASVSITVTITRHGTGDGGNL